MFKRVMNTPSNLLFRILTSASDVFREVKRCKHINYYYVFIKEEFNKLKFEINFKYYLGNTVAIEPESFKNFPDEYFIVMACVILFIIIPQPYVKQHEHQINQINEEAFEILDKFNTEILDNCKIEIGDTVTQKELYLIIQNYTDIVDISALDISAQRASAMYVQSTC